MSVAKDWRRLKLHSPALGNTYPPDVTAARFGFISPDHQWVAPDLHARLHPKSCLSFGWAQLVSPQDMRAGRLVHRAVMLSPRVGSVFMDHRSRRVCPATLATSERIVRALAVHLPGKRYEGRRWTGRCPSFPSPAGNATDTG